MKKKAITYLSLTSISLLGDTVFLYFIVLSTLHLPTGGMFSAVFFSLDAAIRVLVMPITAKWVDHISYPHRWKWAIGFGLLAFALAFLPGFLPPKNISGYYWLCVLLSFLYIVNRLGDQFRFEVSFRFAEEGIIPLSKYAALINLSFRGSQCLAPIIASLIPKTDWMMAASINAFTFFCVVVASTMGFIFFKNLKCSHEKSESAQPLQHIKKLAKWNNITLLLTNICLGGVVLILVYLMKSSTSDLFQYLNPVTSFYLGFVLVLVFLFFYPRQTPLIDKANTNTILFFLAGTCILLAIASSEKSIITLMALFVGGICYGLSLVSFSPAILNHFRGSSMTYYASQSQAFGRVGSVVSSFGIGILIDRDWNPNHLLLMVGITGMSCLFLLYLLKRRLKIKY